MNLPDYFLTRPLVDLTTKVRDEFDALFNRAVRDGSGNFIDYTLAAPKWQFLCYIGDHKDVLLHGSGDPEITEFEPRQSDDVVEFGNQQAVYAASDALWATYFAIVARPRYVWSLVNSCVHVTGPGGDRVPYYYFSVNEDALPHRPWRTGTVYLLPCASFEQQQPVNTRMGLEAETAQWRSFVPVKPLARISVGPTDFPFLDRVRGHDPAVIGPRSRANPDRFPWLDD